MGINAFLSTPPSNPQTEESDIAAFNRYWDEVEKTFEIRDDVTEHMFDRLEVNVIGPKFARAFRRADSAKLDGPHKSRCKFYKSSWDKVETQQHIDRMNRLRDAEMRREAAEAMMPSEPEAVEERPAAYAACAEFYYETMFNAETMTEHDEAQFYGY